MENYRNPKNQSFSRMRWWLLPVALLVACGDDSGKKENSSVSDSSSVQDTAQLPDAVTTDTGPVTEDIGAGDQGSDLPQALDTDDDDIGSLDGADVQSDVPIEDDVSAIEDIQSAQDSAVGNDTDSPTDLGAEPDVLSSDVDSGDKDAATDTAMSDSGSVELDVEQDAGSSTEPLWLLSIDNATGKLQRVDVETGAATDICTVTQPGGGIPGLLKISYPSLTFSRNNELFASRGGTALDRIDPCTCQVTQVGSYGGWNGVNGITSDYGTELFGVSSGSDEVISVDTGTGAADSVGALGVDFGTGGATWSDGISQLYAINGNDNSLYLANPKTGKATFVVELSLEFGTVGIELHPKNGVIYACSTDAVLRKVDPDTGEVTEIGPMGQKGSCTNLAAPWAPVPCLEK